MVDDTDDDDTDDYDYGVDEWDFETADCHMDQHGHCGKAGSEECDWDCPLSAFIRN